LEHIEAPSGIPRTISREPRHWAREHAQETSNPDAFRQLSTHGASQT
jgi:hypothetical protein